MIQRSRRVTVVHVTSYAFAPSSHPAIFRTVSGLADHVRCVVLSSGPNRYHQPEADEEEASLDQPDLTVHGIDPRRLLRRDDVRSLAAALRRRYGRVDAVIGHLGNNGWRALALGRVLDTPVLTIFHGSDANVDLCSAKYRDRYERLRVAPGAHYLGVAHDLVRNLLDSGMSPDRTAVHHLGIDLSEYAPAERDPAGSHFEIAMVGRLIDVKGHADALYALARLRPAHSSLRLHCYGSGPLREKLAGLVDELALAGVVYFHGDLSVGALRARVQQADVLLQPSVEQSDGTAEGVPNSILEAMALAVPVVATRHGGIPEAVIDGECGLLVNEGDRSGIAAALERLAGDSGLRHRLGQGARQRAEAGFDLAERSAALAQRVADMCDGYRRMTRSERRRRWRTATEGLIRESPHHGRRGALGQRLRGWLGGDIDG